MMNTIPSDADHGILPSGQPWVRHSVLKRDADAKHDADAKAMLKRFGNFVAKSMHAERSVPMTTPIEQILARAVIEHFGKRKATPLMKGINVTTIDDIAARNAASIHKMNADPVRRSDDYRQMQERVALADAIEVAMAKGSMPHLAQPQDADGDRDDDQSLDKKIARLMKERGWGIGKFDLAASEVLRGLGLHGEGYGKPVHAKPGSRPLPVKNERGRAALRRSP